MHETRIIEECLRRIMRSEKTIRTVMSRNRWWEDQRLLREYHLASQPDLVWDATVFRYFNKEDNMIEPLSIRIENDVLETCITPERLINNFKHYHSTLPDFQHPGPTNSDLQHPAIRNAYEELKMIIMLAKGKRL